MNAEPSARAKFGAALKHQQKLADEHPELFEQARAIMRRVSDGDILWMTGLMEAIQFGQKLQQDQSTEGSQIAYQGAPRRTRSR